MVAVPEKTTENGIFCYIWCEALAKHIKPFFKKIFKWKDVSAGTTVHNLWGYNRIGKTHAFLRKQILL